jgi:hypothetical protein
MRKLFLVMVASAIVALSVMAAAAGARNSASFAVGSAKADFFVGSQHVAFSAHNGALAFPTPTDCSATGHLNYTVSELGFSLSEDVVMLTIDPGVSGGGLAFIVGQVTKVTPGFGISPGDYAWFDVQDSNMHPDGTGDTFFFEAVSPTPPPCFNGLVGQPITSGNIVVKAGSLVP